MDCSPQDSSVHGISHARILEWIAISFTRGSSQPWDRTTSSALAGVFFTTEPQGSPAQEYTHWECLTLYQSGRIESDFTLDNIHVSMLFVYIIKGETDHQPRLDA